LIVAVLGLVVSGCVSTIPAADQAPGADAPKSERLFELSEFTLPTPEPLISSEVSAVVATEGSRANIRSGPDLDAPIVAKANPGDAFDVTARSDDGEWYQVCCVRGPGDEAGEATERAWIASAVVALDGNADAISELTQALPDDTTASWRVEWTCGSERCEVNECAAQIDASVVESDSEQWLQVEHNVTWDEGCFEQDSWTFEVDRFTGKERTGEFVDNFLYNYWAGVQPGPPTNVFTLDDGRNIAVWCSGPHEFELEEEGGWTTVYEGDSCHDVRTGELVSLAYTKRWLFSGEYEGQKYERAYFGDYETLEQYLIDTNANLYEVEK
jgi:hypothetical protein